MGDRQTIRISCNVRDKLPFSQIEEFQGNLKKRSKIKNAATCAALALGCNSEFSYKGFLQSLTKIDGGFFSPHREPFGNRYIFSDELSAVGNVAGNVSEKIFPVSVKTCDCTCFGKISASFENRNHESFKGFLSIFHNFNLSVTLRKAAVKVWKFAPISAVLKMADCWINNVHNICSLRAFARVVSTLDPLSLGLRFLTPFSYPFRVFGLAAIRFSAKGLKALCLSCLYNNTHYAYCQVFFETFSENNCEVAA